MVNYYYIMFNLKGLIMKKIVILLFIYPLFADLPPVLKKNGKAGITNLIRLAKLDDTNP